MTTSYRTITVVALSACLLCLEILAADAPSPSDIDRVVATAARYQPGDSLEPFRQLEAWVRQTIGHRAQVKPLEAGLIRLLEPSATFEARRFAAKQLGIIGTETALPPLAKLLKNNETVGIACLALTTYPTGKADATLRSALAASTGAARIQIINTVGDRRDAKAVGPLTALAQDTDLPTAEAAVASLGKIGNKAAWQVVAGRRASTPPALTPALVDATLRCAAGLASAGDRKTAVSIYERMLARTEPPYARRSAFDGLLQIDKDQGEQRIEQVLRGDDPVLKPVAIAAVRSLRSKRASEVFAGLLARLAPGEQVWMIDSLAARGDPAARAAIGNALGSPSPPVRLAAIEAIGRIGNNSSVRLLAQAAAKAADAEENRALEAALVSLPGGKDTDQAIVQELSQAPPSARALLITVLGQRQGAAANPLLLREADEPSPLVAKAAFRALAKTATAADVPALLAKLSQPNDPSLRSEIESAAAQALSRIDSPAQRSTLVRQALEHAPHVESRCALLGLLPGCPDAPALAALKTAAGDPDAVVRDAAIRALADWPALAAWEPLLAALRQPENDALRGIALRALVRLAGEVNTQPDAQLIDRYKELLANARGDADLKLILGALAGAGIPDALPLVLPLLANAGVRAEAEVAVKRIAAAIQTQHPDAAKDALQKLETKP